MKVAIAFILLVNSLNCVAQKQKFEGLWEGKINAGVDLRLVFEFKTNETGMLIAKLTSPDQSATAVKMDSAWVKDDSIFVISPSFRISFSGVLKNDSIINGDFVQGKPFELLLKKVKAVSVQYRPQTPIPPFSYNSEDVSFYNKSKSLNYGGTLTWPKKITVSNQLQLSKYPVVLLISGSGPQDRDETLFNHKPFALIADNLTKLGFAVLRVDDRGVGKSTGNFSSATTADFADDVEAGIEFLKSNINIDTLRMGLIGHSEGGMIAPIVASRRKDINFIVLLAGPGLPIVQLMAEQAEAIAKSSGSTAAFAKSEKELYVLGATEINKHLDSSTTFHNMNTALNAWIAKQPATIISGLHLTSRPERESFLHSQLGTLQSPWFKYFLSFDPTTYLVQLRCSVLALNGSKDIQVIASSNLAGIKAALKKSHSKSYEVKELPGLNHLFQTCKSCTAREYGDLVETFSPTALQIMDDWLLKQVGNRAN